jgi:hypothetical protein
MESGGRLIKLYVSDLHQRRGRPISDRPRRGMDPEARFGSDDVARVAQISSTLAWRSRFSLSRSAFEVLAILAIVGG